MISDIYVKDDRHLRVAMVLEMERKMERLKNKNILITGGDARNWSGFCSGIRT